MPYVAGARVLAELRADARPTPPGHLTRGEVCSETDAGAGVSTGNEITQSNQGSGSQLETIGPIDPQRFFAEFLFTQQLNLEKTDGRSRGQTVVLHGRLA
jgi:hypothetical protein